MWNKTTNVMLYVENVIEEKIFWNNIGFEVFNEEEIMGYLKFDMQPSKESNIIFTVFSKKFIKAFSPEVLNNVPSILFSTHSIHELHQKIKKYTQVSDIHEAPFLNFNFSSPSGIYFAVKGV